MKTLWNQSVGALVGTTIAVAGFGVPAIAAPEANQIAQDAPGARAVKPGECRAVNRPTPVFQQASTVSDAITILPVNRQVTAADAGSGGFLRISAPVNGYVQTGVLKLCGDTPPANTCRRVVSPPEGLLIRSGPSTTSATVGGVGVGERVFTTTDPATSQRESSGRVWIQINRPVAGWVSNGFQGGQGNLVYCQ